MAKETTRINSQTPSSTSSGSPRKERIILLRNKAFKRRETLIRKCDEIRRLCGAQVYLAIRLRGRLDIYESETTQAWPMSETSIVSTETLVYYCSLTIQ